MGKNTIDKRCLDLIQDFKKTKHTQKETKKKKPTQKPNQL